MPVSAGSACGPSSDISSTRLLDGGADVVAMGHNPTMRPPCSSATLRWNTGLLALTPVRRGRVPEEVKPLVRLGEREMAAYCVLRGIDYQVEECPMADGNRHLGYKEALNAIEVQSPGSKHAFYFGFLDKVAPALDEGAELEKEGLGRCARCGAPSAGEICSFCRLVERAGRARS